MARYDFTSRRLFVEADLGPGRPLALDRDQANYLLNVLRLEAGAELLVFNGRDGEWRAAIIEAGKRRCLLEAREQTRPQTPLPDLWYCFAPLKAARLDYIVQKAVEMGAGRIVPMLTRHTQVARLKQERMLANAIEAAEQCGVIAVPEVAPEIRFAQLLATMEPARTIVFCDEEAEIADPVAALATLPEGPLAVLIGPEGGFSAEEREALLQRRPVLRLALGPRILRADTAAVAALALVQAVRGDWR